MPDKRVVYIQYTNPAGYPPLEHSSRILAEAGWQVVFLGTDAAGSGTLRFPPHPNIVVQRLAFHPGGWLQKIHYLYFGLWVFLHVLRVRPRWIYASDLLSCPIAFVLTFVPGLRVVYHEHDSPNRVEGHAWYGNSFIKVLLWTRRLSGRRADAVILPNQRRAQRFSCHISRRQSVFTVWNCPRTEEVMAAKGFSGDSRLSLWYHGSIVPERVPVTFLYAMVYLPDNITLSLAGYETVGNKEYVQELLDLAKHLNVSERVAFLGSLSRHRLFQQCWQHDVGLSLMPLDSVDINLQEMVGASNKPFDYLACGLALLVSDLQAWRATYVSPGYGLACDPQDPESIAETVRWFLTHPKQMRMMGEQGRQRILREWNYKHQFNCVMTKLQ